MGGNRFRLKPCTLVAASISLLFASSSLWANPTAPRVVSGQVNFQQPNASVLNVTNSPGAIIHWQGFSIGASEVTRFIQQSAASSVLNRVTGGNVSQIYGQLLSNGRVFLINPGGIVVGPGAIVDTAGFVASTLNLLDADFLAGKLKFQGDASSGSIINQGWIRTGYGGHVLLVAPTIANSGLIHTPGGDLILAAGQKVTMSTLDLAGVQLEVQAPTDSVVNVGKLLAEGGAVGVFAGTLRHSGEIRANALVSDEAGRIVLKGQNEVQLAAGSTTTADGRTGGSVTVQSAGLTRVAGDVSASGSAGAGGSIVLLGDQVALVAPANVDASGTSGGGRILVGGDYQGANSAVQNSSNTFVGLAATLRADATQSGDGGRIIIWSDDKAQFYGSLSAQGGPDGGNGGFAEVSGKQGLVFQGGANLAAPMGSLGTLLLDPLDLYAFAGGGLDPAIINENTIFPTNAATVSPATLAGISGNVTLQASRYMRISDPITLTTAGQGLTATVGTYAAPVSPDPLSLATNTAINNIPNRLDIAADITTAGGAVSLGAPAILGVASATITSAGGPIGLTSTSGPIQASALSLAAGAGAVTATSADSLQLAGVTGSAFTASGPNFLSIGPITTGSGAASLTSTGSAVFASSITTTGGNVAANAPFGVFTGPIATGGGSVTLAGGGSSANAGDITAGAGNVTLSGTSINAGAIDNTGTVSLTATNGSIFASRVDSAASLTATATSTSSAQVFINGSLTVLNANTVSATAGSCFNAFSCPSASVVLNASGPVHVGTVSASAQPTTANAASFGAAYADPRFESISESVSIFSSGGPIRAMSATSSISATDVSLSTGLLSGGGIGKLTGTPLPLRVDVRRELTFNPNGEFNVQLTGTGPNRLDMEIGVAPATQSYTGSLSRTGLALNVSANDTTVTATTFNVASGFDQRVFSGSPGITLRVPNGNLSAPTVNVPAGDVTGAATPNARFNCDTLGGVHCPAHLNFEPLAVVLSSSGNLSVGTYTRAAGTAAKSSGFESDAGSVTLGTVNASRDNVSIAASTNVSVTGAVTTLGAVDITAQLGNVTINSVNTSGGPGSVTINALGTVGAPSSSNSSALEIQAGTSSVTINAGTIGNSANTFPLDIAAGSVSLTSTSGGIGFTGKPVFAITQNLTIDAASTFNVNTSTADLRNLAVTADPAGVASGGLAQVTSNGTNYSFASDGTNFTIGGGSFAAVPAAHFSGGTLSFTATSGNLTLNALDFSASNGNFSATTNGNLGNITQNAGQAINLGTGSLTLGADGSVTLESVNAGGMTATNATTNVPSGCDGTFGPCGVSSFTANQTLTDLANAGGTWSVNSRGAITTQALHVGGISFTAASGDVVVSGSIGTAARPVTSASISTTVTGAGGNIQVTGPIEADSLSLGARGSVTVGAGSLPANQATALINAINTDAASIELSSQTSTVTVNGVMNATDITLIAPTSINTGNINPAATAPGTVAFLAASGATPINTGSLDGTSISTGAACIGCSPGDININGAIGGAAIKPTHVSISGNLGVVIAGNVTMDPAVAGNLLLGAGTTLTGTGGAALGAITAGDGTSMTLNANNGLIATPFQITRVDAGPTGSVTINAPAGIVQATSGASDGIRAGTVSLSANSTGSAIEGLNIISPLPLTLRETSDLTLSTGGSININRTGASGVPLLANLDITRSDGAAAFSLSGFAAGQNVTHSFLSGVVSVGVSNTTATPLHFSYTNNDFGGVNGNLTGTGITTKGGDVFLSAAQNLTTGAINSKSGAALVPDGGITLQAGQALNVSGSVDSGGGAIFAQGASVSGAGQLVSTSSVFASAFSGNVGSVGTPLAISAPTVGLEAFGASPSGNVFATLTGTADLAIFANDGFTVSSNVALTDVSLTTQTTGTGPLSLTTTVAQNFGLARNGTGIDITGITSTPALNFFGLSANGGGGLAIKGGIAATQISVGSSGVLTLDGSTPLVLSNSAQNLSGSSGVVIQGDVTVNATTSQAISTSADLTFTGKGTLSSAGSQNLSASGSAIFTSQGGSITLNGANQNISASGNLEFNAAGGAISVTGTDQTIQVFGASSSLKVLGGSAAGQSVTFAASSSQRIQTPDTPASLIEFYAGSGTDASVKVLYTGTGEQLVQGGNIELRGGSAAGAVSLISTGTGSQRVRANTLITLDAGTVAGADARIENTSSNTQRVGESEFIPFFGPEPYQTDGVIVQGGNGAEAAIVAAGLQKIQASNGSIHVLGGSGSGGRARIETTSAGIEQRIGCNNTFELCAGTLDTLEVSAGASGATAQVLNAGIQRLRGTNLTITGHANNGGFARIVTTGTVQSMQFFGTDLITAGTGTGSDASITSAGTQESFQFGTLSLIAGGPNSVARISAAGSQDISASSITLTAKGDHVTQIANASAIIEGQNQSIFAGTITLNGGGGVSGNTSDALIRNTAGAQFVSGSSGITMNGGHTFSTTGILNQGTGTQSVSANLITMVSDPVMPPAHADSFVLIQNTPSTDQSINASLSLTNSGAGTVAILTPANQTIFASSGGITISSQGTDVASVTKVAAGGDQQIRAQFVEVTTSAGSVGSASLEATGSQWIHTTAGASSPSGASMRIAAAGSGTAKIEAGTSQLIELDYPEQMQGFSVGGDLVVGDSSVLAVGTSRLKAADQNIFARSVTVQTGGTGSLSEIKAANTQVISTLNGDVSVLGGLGDNSLASIDPVTQTILVNGSVSVIGGEGINAVAQIVNGSGTQTILATNGNVSATGGTAPGADALITSVGPQSVQASPPGTVTPTSTAGGGNAIIGGGSPSSPITIINEIATAPILVAEQELEQTLTEVTPEGIGQEELLTRRAPICR